MMLSVVFPILKSFRTGIQHDAGPPWFYVGIGLMFIIVVGALIDGRIVGSNKICETFQN